MKMKQEKKEYKKPVIQVFELQHEGHLLTLSGPGNYGNGGDPFNSPAPSLDLDNEDLLFDN